MKYTFNLVGVSPVLQFFDHQQHSLQKPKNQGLEYVASHSCTLDAFLESVEPVPLKWGWEMDEVVGTVVNFWMNNSESIRYWKERLQDAGRNNLLVARVAEMKALQAELELLLNQNM